MSQQSAEFHKPRLAQIYENFNQFSEDESFWMKTIEGLDVSHITDFGCGTGMFTIVKIYGGWTGEAYSETSGEMIFLAQKI